MELLEMMEAIDAGTNSFGPLSPEVRARLFAVLDSPSDETWNNAHGIVVTNRGFGGMTLWQALLEFTDYRVNRGPVVGGTWESVPTQTQLADALTKATTR